MAAISNDDLESLISPYSSLISEAVLEAWAGYLKTPKRHLYCARTRANVVWDLVTAALEAALDPLPKMHVSRSNNSCLFMIGQVMAFRFKKADASGMSSNYPTQMAVAFHDPEQLILGIPEAARTELVYVLNKLETEINEIKFIRRNGDVMIWDHVIYNSSMVEVVKPESTENEQDKSVARRKLASVKVSPQEIPSTALDKDFISNE
ncbi:MAG TPA: hypothetical protein VL020_03000 [Pseudomonadales bacterium]|nr:hypothetical protein [Pseudomonadales bacterium]